MYSKQKLTLQIAITFTDKECIKCEEITESLKMVLANLDYLTNEHLDLKWVIKSEPVRSQVELPPLSRMRN